MSYLIHSKKVAEWSVLILCALLPFFFLPAIWVTVPAAKMMLVVVLTVVALLAWILASFNEGTLRTPKSLLLAAAALIPIAYLISTLATGASRESFVGSGGQDTVVTVALLFALLLVSANVFATSSGRAIGALRTLTLGGILLLIIQFFHLFFPSFTFGGALVGSAASALGSWHDLGIFLGLFLFLSLSLLSTPVAAGFWRAIFVGAAIASGILLVIINSSDVWVGLGILGLLYGGYIWWLSRKQQDVSKRSFFPRRTLLWVVFGAAAIGLYWGAPLIHNVLPVSLQVTQFEVRPSWEGTLAVGKEVFAEPGSVFFGSGPNTFPRAWGLYKPLAVNTTQFWNTDFYSGVGFIPTSFVTVGILGFIAWTAVLLALLLSVWRVLFPRVPSSISLMRGIVAAGALYLTIFHVLYIPGPALSTLTFILFGLLVAEELRAGTIRDLILPLSWDTWAGRICTAALVVFGLVILFVGVQSLRALVSESLVNRAAVAYNDTQDITVASRFIGQALAVKPQNDRAHRAAVELGILQLSRLAAAGDTSEAARAELQRTLTSTIEHGLAAISIEDRNYQNWLELARLYGELAGAGVEGADKSARAAYAKVAVDNPTSPIPALGEAQLDLLAKNDAAARTHLKAAIALKADLALAHYLLSQVEARAGDLAAARDEAALAVQYASQDPLGWYNLGAVFYARGEYGDAAGALKRAIGLENNYANALFLLGLSSYKLGEKENALLAFEAVAALNPADEALAGIVADLKAGKDPFVSQTPAL